MGHFAIFFNDDYHDDDDDDDNVHWSGNFGFTFFHHPLFFLFFSIAMNICIILVKKIRFIYTWHEHVGNHKAKKIKTMSKIKKYGKKENIHDHHQTHIIDMNSKMGKKKIKDVHITI